MAAIEKRFEAAVNVIKGLPKNGPYQPSTSMMLKFYGLFKQATEGECEHKKPSFWDVVGRAKWDAWSSNRHLSKEQAKQRYVESLQEIIETMSFTENVQNFVGSLSGLENINLDELELVAPGMRELAESHPSSPFNSRTNSPQHGASANATASTTTTQQTGQSTKINKQQDTTTTDSPHPVFGSGPLTNGHHINGYIEQEPDQEPARQAAATTAIASALNNYTSSNSNAVIDPSDDEYDDPYDLNHDLTVAISQNSDVLKQIQLAISRMNADIGNVQQRMSKLDRTLQDLRCIQQQLLSGGNNKALRRYPSWWPFTDISPAWFALFVLWPFVVQRFARLLDTKVARSRR